MSKIKKHINLVLFLCFLCPEIIAQDLIPPINNYKVSEYNAASQNWGLTTNKDGELFVANNRGLLHFNGERWKLNKLPNNTIIRSIAIVDNKVFTGSYEEFGYWTTNSIGQFEYVSLTNLIKNHTFTNEEFWQIIPYNNTVIFRSFSGIYTYQNDKITVLDTDQIITDLIVKDDKIIAASRKQGLYEFVNNKLIPLKDQKLFKNKTITDMVLYDGGILVGTKLQGCYFYKDDKVIPWNETINGFLQQHQLNKMLAISPYNIVFGTIKNGIYIYDTKTKKIEQINRKIGLQNNTILSLHKFKEQLWVGLDSGIDRIQLDSPTKYYTDYSGVVGTVYDIAVLDTITYLGSNTGVYYIQNDTLQFVEGSQGHVWDLTVLDDQLFCGHNTGTFIVNTSTLQKISNFSGGYQMIKIPEQPHTFLQGTYNGIVKYHKTELGIWHTSRLKGIEFPVKQLCFENPTSIWVAHPYKGFYKIKINESYDTIEQIQEFHTDTTDSNYQVKLYNIKNQIVFNSKGTWYKYDPIPDKIVKFKEFETYTNIDLVSFDQEHFWFIDNENPKRIIYTDLKKDSLVISENQLMNRLVPDAENSLRLNDSLHLITLGDGYAQVNFLKLKGKQRVDSIPAPKIYVIKDEETLYPLDTEIIKIPFKNSQNITLEVSSPGLINKKYYYELSGTKTQSSYLETSTINLQNLPYGNYKLNIFTIGVNNQKSIPKEIQFEIKPPWYLSNVSLSLYFLILLGLIYLIRLYNKNKLKKHHKELKERLEKQQNEKIIAFEREKLTKEIKLKQKELAGITMNIAKKNEVILELKSMILLNKEKFSNQQRYKSIIKKVNDSINNNEDWKRFEVNFKELHEDFFDNLLKHYPQLTPKDLKLCAYLKMNLSSKEIAPLMAITIRGVEIHRYRLRKKLEIDSSKNLSNFLITFK
ncbi:Two component regulator three Y domain-containing protein [Aquimarina addita]|uniref:helix-turn-helix and ligand-binding sensor domain-containing protein n=1 Tax=Aquimarina addita TaxID=870485 RepID=UPI0031E8CE9C